MPTTSYPILKTFIHEAYSRRLTGIQLRNTAGQQGYVQQNMYTILNKDKDDNTNNNATVITQTSAAATTESTIGTTYAATTTPQQSPPK